MRAATRDASWYKRPSRGIGLVYHVVTEDIEKNESACGILVVATEGFAPSRDLTIDAKTVSPQNRCGRPGCKAKWPTWNQEDKD